MTQPFFISYNYLKIQRLWLDAVEFWINKEKDYFVRNQKRMQYNLVEVAGLPTGSGAMESAIRRVVNLQLKLTFNTPNYIYSLVFNL